MDPRSAIVQIATRAIGRGPDVCASAAPGYDLASVSWCQIFWLYCLREAGLTDLLWADVKRKGWVDGWLPRTVAPLPGDLGYIAEPNQHGAIIAGPQNEAGRIPTVDGNSTGRVVARKARFRREYSCFYSIDPLIKAMNRDEGKGRWRK